MHTVYSSAYVVVAQTKPFQPNPLKHNCHLHSARCAAYCRYAEYESVFRASVSFPEELTKAEKKPHSVDK